MILSAAFLALSVPFAGISPSFSQVAGVLALALTVVGILLAVRSQESYVTSNTEGATKDPGVRLVREKSPGR